VAGTRSAAQLLARAGGDARRSLEWRRQARGFVLSIALGAGLFAAWSSVAPLSGAVVAPAQVRVEYRRKTVQHQEGGIVREILVHDGQSVRAGEPLLVVGDTRREGDLALLREQWLAARVHAARAEAESRLAPRFDLPEELRQEGASDEVVARERSAFDARRHSLDEQCMLLQAQADEAQAQAAARGSQVAALASSAVLADEELAINRRLAEQGFASRARLIGLERAAGDYAGRIGEARGEQAAARLRIAELRSRIAQLKSVYQAQGADESREAANRVRELAERLRPSTDEVERQVVRAPVDGTVMSVKVAAAGDVIAPRQALLDVVPAREKLVVDARIEPQDIEHVRAGGTAEVRLVSSDARAVPLLPAKVTFVSADRVIQAETGKAWFEATVEVDAPALARDHAPPLAAGMPAEVYVTTGDRTLLEYLTKPLRAFSQRALREPG
jgi:HlyD family type I secretion membrane fusion protein